MVRDRRGVVACPMGTGVAITTSTLITTGASRYDACGGRTRRTRRNAGDLGDLHERFSLVLTSTDARGVASVV
jgi:hypothetical protein